MPRIDFVPCDEGLTREEIGQRMQQGWVLVGRQAVNTGVATPDSPGGAHDVDVWMLMEPTMPQRGVVEALVRTHMQSGGFSPALDSVCQMLFDAGIEELVEYVKQQQQASEEQAEPEGDA